ncbi:MAG: hypothetical protein E7588_09710 [Ruminococcaceae bacterium]|nr:hypothetical protein [Oscillospiraceae bacterium]
MYKCQNCGKPATYFVKTSINGNVQTTALCAECAAKQELNIKNQHFDELSDIFSPFFFGTGTAIPEIKRCPACGASFRQICDNSKYGCPECYNTFRTESEPSLKKLHGELVHKGKTPKSVPVKTVNEVEELKKQLAKAVSEENYEKAAELRDRIKLINDKKEGE